MESSPIKPANSPVEPYDDWDGAAKAKMIADAHASPAIYCRLSLVAFSLSNCTCFHDRS